MSQLFDELFFAIIILAFFVNAGYLVFRLVLFSLSSDIHGSIHKAWGRWLKQPGNPVRATTWIIAGMVTLAVWLISGNSVVDDMRGEITGIAITIILIDELVIYRNRLERKQELFQQIHSRVTDSAVEAVRLLRENGWFDEIDKNRLQVVEWAKVDLVGANLERANLGAANLEGAYLAGTNLQGAKLMEANLKEAYLWGANLEGASLAGANLEGARYSNDTLWPEDFDPKETGSIEDGFSMNELPL